MKRAALFKEKLRWNVIPQEPRVRIDQPMNKLRCEAYYTRGRIITVRPPAAVIYVT